MASGREVVVLVHGLWLPGWGMALLRRRVARCGFEARIFPYKTVMAGLRENAARLQVYLARFPAESTVHLIGYSLGGLVIRALFHDFPEQHAGRIVNLGSPHLGSHAAKRFGRWSLGRKLLGRSIGDLISGVHEHWAAPPREIGVIAGELSLGLGRLFPGLPQPNDGTVAVAETQLAGAADHITLPVSHVGMLVSSEVARQTCEFLRSGRFSR